MVPENGISYSIETFRKQKRLELIEEFDKFKSTHSNWESKYAESIKKNGCPDEHNSPLEIICKYLKNEKNDLIGILAEKDAAKVLGISIPDLLVIYKDGIECIEYQNGDKRIATLMKKMVRYGPATDSFSIGIASKSKEHIRTNWDALRQITFNGGLKDVYREHLKILGMTRVYPKFDNGEDKKHFKLEEGTFYFDEDKDKVRVAFNPAKLEDLLNLKFYFVSESDVEVLRPDEV